MKKHPLLVLAIAITLGACSTTPDKEQSAKAAAEPQERAIPETAAVLPSRPFPADSFHDLLVAEFAVRRGRYDLALGNYLQQAHFTQDTAVTARATRLAQFLNADKATLDAAQLWVELEPDNMEAQYTTATTLAKNQRPEQALQHMEQVLIGGGPTNFAAIAASTLQQPGADREAFGTEIDKLLAKYPDNTQLLTSKALMLQQCGEVDQSLTLIQDVLKLDPDDLHAVVVEARLLLQLGRNEEAFQRLEQVVQQHPENRRLRLQYARMLMTSDIVLAKQQFETLLTQTPRDPDLLLSLALISRETGQLDQAKKYLSQLLATGQRSNEAYFYLGQLAEQQHQQQQALDIYQHVGPGPDYFSANNRICAIYLQQDDVEAARDHLKAQRLAHPDLAVRLYLLESEVLLSSEMYDEGQQLLTEALLIHPDQLNLLYARSMFSEKRNELELMEKDLRAVIAQDPENTVALNALGYILANRTDRLDEARQLISQALTLQPDDPAILDSLGWIEFKSGNLKQALQLLEAAYSAYPDHEVAAHLGEVLWALQQQERAINVWTEALQRFPNSPILQETIQRLSPDTLPANVSEGL